MTDILSLKDTVIKYNLIAKKSLGQNFLFDQNLTDKIVRSSLCTYNDTILEIGPGPGGLTRSILKHDIEKLIVIEPDKRCITALGDLKSIYQNKLEIIEGDALAIDMKSLIPKNTKIIANLPYNIATVLLFKWLEDINYYGSLTLMFQKEVADRIIAKPRTKQYGRVSVMTQSFCDVTHAFDIPAEAFVPKPKVTSSVINIRPHNKNNDISRDKLAKLCKTVFNHRRKLLSSTIKPLIADPLEIFNILSISKNARPEELSIDQFCKLTEYIN